MDCAEITYRAALQRATKPLMTTVMTAHEHAVGIVEMNIRGEHHRVKALGIVAVAHILVIAGG